MNPQQLLHFKVFLDVVLNQLDAVGALPLPRKFSPKCLPVSPSCVAWWLIG